MHPRSILVAGLALIGAACGPSALPSSPTSTGGTPAGIGGTRMIALARQTAVQVPFQGQLDGVVTVSPIPGGPSANVFINASGTATHLGRFTVTVPHLVNFATAVGEGTFTFTAANRDTVTAHFTGAADTSAAVFTIVEHATITGGTGRFAGASGSFIANRRYDPAA